MVSPFSAAVVASPFLISLLMLVNMVPFLFVRCTHTPVDVHVLAQDEMLRFSRKLPAKSSQPIRRRRDQGKQASIPTGALVSTWALSSLGSHISRSSAALLDAAARTL
jgi:hypothetical protein